MTGVRFLEVGDSVLMVEFGRTIDPSINDRIIAAASALRIQALSGVRDIVPTYCSLAIYFDPLRTNVSALRDILGYLIEKAATGPSHAGRVIEVPVWYGGLFGPDLPDVARFAGLTEDEVVSVHTAPIYRVYMLGFMPGRAYLGSVDSRIAMPRHATPRPRVPEGSVGIARLQTGFSAAEHPNGWRLIGRTPLHQFDLRRDDPFLFKPGDRAKFVAIRESDYRELSE